MNQSALIIEALWLNSCYLNKKATWSPVPWLTLVCWKCDPIPIPDGEPGDGTGEVLGEGWRFPVISIMSWPMSFSSSSGKGRSNMSSGARNRGKMRIHSFKLNILPGYMLNIATNGHVFTKKTLKFTILFKSHLIVGGCKEIFCDKDATCWWKWGSAWSLHITMNSSVPEFENYIIYICIYHVTIIL